MLLLRKYIFATDVITIILLDVAIIKSFLCSYYCIFLILSFMYIIVLFNSILIRNIFIYVIRKSGVCLSAVPNHPLSNYGLFENNMQEKQRFTQIKCFRKSLKLFFELITD